MSTYRDIAELIPSHIRKEIITRDLIRAALGMNEYMKYLFEVWYLYVDPHGPKQWDCGICRSNIKENFLQLEAELINLEKEKNLLDGIS